MKNGLQLDQLRRDPQVYGALAQTLAHQRELAGLEVAQAAVDELARAARRAAGERTLLDEERAVSGGSGGLQHSGSVDAAAHDDYIECSHLTLNRATRWAAPRRAAVRRERIRSASFRLAVRQKGLG